jgi:hypothetical protein
MALPIQSRIETICISSRFLNTNNTLQTGLLLLKECTVKLPLSKERTPIQNNSFLIHSIRDMQCRKVNVDSEGNQSIYQRNTAYEATGEQPLLVIVVPMAISINANGHRNSHYH